MLLAMTDVWVCTSCKSINRRRDSRCYSCGQRQAEVAAVAAETPDLRLAEATAERTVRGYMPSWPFAAAASVLILAVAGMGLVLVVETVRAMSGLRQAFVDAVRLDDTSNLDALLAQQQSLASPSLMRFGLLVLAVIAFGLWLSRVRLNIPALGGGTPAWSPVKARVYPLIPIVNFVRVPAMIQDAFYRLDPTAGGFLLVLFAWIAVVGSWLLGFLGGIVIAGGFVATVVKAASRDEVARAFGALLDQSLVLTVVTEALTTVGAVLLVAVIFQVESRSRSRDREIRAGIVASSGYPQQAPSWSVEAAYAAARASAGMPAAAATTVAAPVPVAAVDAQGAPVAPVAPFAPPAPPPAP